MTRWWEKSSPYLRRNFSLNMDSYQYLQKHIETSMIETKPIVTERDEFEYRDKSTKSLFQIFGL